MFPPSPPSYEEALTSLADSEAKQETGARELKMAHNQMASLWGELEQIRKQIDGSTTSNGIERLVSVPLWVCLAVCKCVMCGVCVCVCMCVCVWCVYVWCVFGYLYNVVVGSM